MYHHTPYAEFSIADLERVVDNPARESNPVKKKVNRNPVNCEVESDSDLEVSCDGRIVKLSRCLGNTSGKNSWVIELKD